MAKILATACALVTQGVLLFFSLLIIPELCLLVASQAAPSFLPTQQNITVMVGQLAKLPCRIKNLGSKDVVWRHQGDDRFLTIGKLTWVKDSDIITEHQRQSRQVSDWNLLIKNAQKDRTGVYECQVTATKKYVREVYLRVVVCVPTLEESLTCKQDPPAEKPDIYLQGSKYVPVGGEIRLLCNISGRLGAQWIDWFKDGDKIDNEKYRKYIITRFWAVEDRSMYSELIVDKSQQWDSGTYICRGPKHEITSQEVTVRVGGSSNVKREYGPERENEQLQTQSHYNSGHFRTENSRSDEAGSSPGVSPGHWLVSVVCLTVIVFQHWRT